MASLRKKERHYYARFCDSSRSPKRKELALRTTRKDVAKLRLGRWEREYARGIFDPWKDKRPSEHKSLIEAKDAFLQLKRKEGRRPNTIEAYGKGLKGLQQHAPPDINVRDVSPDHVRAYVYQEEVSSATQAHRYRHLRAFFNWCEKENLLSSNPIEEVSKPREGERKVAPLTSEDMEKLFEAISNHREQMEGRPGPNPDDTWLKEIVSVSVGTGLRRGELLNLRWEDINLDEGSEHLLVRNRESEGFRVKSGSERYVHLVGVALRTLRTMREKRSPRPDAVVFVDDKDRPIKPDRVSKRFKFYVRKAGLSERLTFHSCRHETGTRLADAGVPIHEIQGFLGHQDLMTTRKYIHESRERSRKKVRKALDS
jgi:integrase